MWNKPACCHCLRVVSHSKWVSEISRRFFLKSVSATLLLICFSDLAAEAWIWTSRWSFPTPRQQHRLKLHQFCHAFTWSLCLNSNCQPAFCKPTVFECYERFHTHHYTGNLSVNNFVLSLPRKIICNAAVSSSPLITNAALWNLFLIINIALGNLSLLKLFCVTYL